MVKWLLLWVLMGNVSTNGDVYPKKKGALRVMSYNVRNGRGLDEKTDLSRIVNVFQRTHPDVVAVQELDSATQRSNGVYVLKEIGEQVKMHYTYGPAIEYKGGKYGVGILSKEKPLSVRQIPLPGREEKRTLLLAEFKNYVLACSHFSLTEADRLESIEIIRSQVKGFDKPVLLAGDLNDLPGSKMIESLSGDWKNLSGTAFTFPANEPNKCIDYIFGSGKMKLIQSVVVDEPIASDHRPLFVDVKLK